MFKHFTANDKIILHNTIITFLAIILTTLLYKLLKYHICLITYPHQLELREGGMVLSTDFILRGGNPYDFVNHPMYMNVYGIMYNYIVIPFYKLFGAIGVHRDKLYLLAHRFVSGVFIFLSCMIVVLIMLRLKIKLIYIYGALIIQYASLIYSMTSLSRPDSMGLFLFLLCIYIPWRFGYSMQTLVWSIFIGILSFYTKPYFVLGIFIVISYVLFYISKEKGLKCILVFFISFLLSAIWVNKYYESYFYECLFLQFNINNYHMDYLFSQLLQFAKHLSGLILYMVFVLLINLGIYKSNILSYYKDVKINIRKIKEPFFSKEISLFTYCVSASFCTLVLKMGGTNGAWMTYFFQLFLPFFLIYTLKLTINNSNLKFETIVFMLLTIYTSYCYSTYLNITSFAYIFSYDPSEVFRAKALDDQWERYDSLIQQNENVLLAAPFSVSAINNGKIVYDSGFTCYRDAVTPNNPIIKKLFPKDFHSLNEKFLDYIE
ncbi:MAG: hypothetical protein HQK92_00480, partial [Nitrospirae bacterium]|nr:hypothetical protein [Nitrospirota bacterium]